MSEAAFELSGVSYAYQNASALDGFAMSVRSGERVALLGANGSGKSTLLRLMDALYFCDRGTVKAFGEPLTEEGMQDEAVNLAFRRRVGFVFQNPDVQLFNPTVFDELAFGPLQTRLGQGPHPRARQRNPRHVRDHAPEGPGASPPLRWREEARGARLGPHPRSGSPSAR